MRCRLGLRQRLMLGTLALGALAILAAGLATYGLTRTQVLASEALAAQRRIEAYGALSARVNEWVLAALGPGPGRAEASGAVRDTLDLLDHLVEADVAQAPGDTADRARRATTVARVRGQFDVLERALAGTAPGSPAGESALGFYGAQVPPLVAAQVQQETIRRDDAISAMDALRARLSRLALALAITAPLLLVGLYLALVRPLFARLASATAAAEGLAAGAATAGSGGHDELGLLLARLRLTAARLARGRARLETTVAERTAALSRANARLSQADGERRRFFADVGHELRTPLTVILGEAELGMGHADAEVRSSFGTVHGRALRLFRRIEDLLRIARSESGQLELASEPVELDATVARALADAAPLLTRAGITARADLPTLRVTGDPDWLRQVFAGLLENAAKYAGRGAAVTISGRARGGVAEVTVADTGPGLPPERLATAFDRFARGTAPAPGFGVGLALARWVVEAHGGSLAAETAGNGLRLVMRLPLAATETPQ